MTDKNTKKTVAPKRRSAADIEARNRASYEALVDLYGLKGNKKPANTKKK